MTPSAPSEVPRRWFTVRLHPDEAVLFETSPSFQWRAAGWLLTTLLLLGFAVSVRENELPPNLPLDVLGGFDLGVWIWERPPYWVPLVTVPLALAHWWLGRRTRWAVTSQRVLARHGVLASTTTVAPLRSVTHTRTRGSFLARELASGRVDVHAGRVRLTEVSGQREPGAFADALHDAMTVASR